MYCVYTDAEVADSNGNFDHVIPLALGGHNAFTIWSNRDFNSGLGSKIDSAISNDLLVMFARREADARGHSGTKPVPTFKRSELSGRPVQLRFEKDQLQVWDAISARTLEEPDFVGKPMKSEFRIDPLAPLRFAAKVALGGAFFIYGDAILRAMDCAELRLLMSTKPEDRDSSPLRSSKIMACDRFHPDVERNGQARMFKALCELDSRSVFLSIPHDDSISFHVGVLGTFMCSLICPADTSRLPNDEFLNDLGHAILLGPDVERISFREMAIRASKTLEA